jgi:uncharacterized protein involved in exopolysaccharide biosynthesis
MNATTNSAAEPARPTGILSRVTHRLWQIFLLWMIVAVPLLSLISLSTEPTYQAFSTLQVEPVSRGLFRQPESEVVDYKLVLPYLQTQVGLLTSDRVLNQAILDPAIAPLSVIRESDDPKADLRRKMVVEIVPGAYLIRVALELRDANQAAAIVNIVVHSYLNYSIDYERGRYAILQELLHREHEGIQKKIREKRAELLERLVSKGSGNTAGTPLILNESGKAADPTQPVFSGLTDEISQQIASEMVKTDLELIKAQAMLETTQAASQGQNDLRSRQTLDELKLNVTAFLKQKENLVKYFARSTVEKNLASNDTFEVAFLNRQLEILSKDANQLDTNIKELQFKASQEDFRVSQVDQAIAPKAPTNNNRLKYIAAAPIVVLLLLIGYFLLMPLKHGAVSPSSAGPSPPGEPAS